jgi:hypothetical protein
MSMSDVLEISKSAILRRVLATSSARRFSSVCLLAAAAELLLIDRVVAADTPEFMLKVEPSSLSLDCCLLRVTPRFEVEELGVHKGKVA